MDRADHPTKTSFISHHHSLGLLLSKTCSWLTSQQQRLFRITYVQFVCLTYQLFQVLIFNMFEKVEKNGSWGIHPFALVQYLRDEVHVRIIYGFPAIGVKSPRTFLFIPDAITAASSLTDSTLQRNKCFWKPIKRIISVLLLAPHLLRYFKPENPNF